MDIKPTTGNFTVYLSQYCTLDSNVITGGGTDVTEIVQKILDKALEWGSLHLVVDGAALISGICVHSNTTLECLNASCGFYMKDHSDDAIIKNADLSDTQITNTNITLKGGTYNHNSKNQSMVVAKHKQFGDRFSSPCNVAMRFYGVKNFKMEDVTIYDQKRYALLMACWENVTMHNINIPLPDIADGTNQDGLHFLAPGKNLTLRNCYGRCGDDFIAINTDEDDRCSSISGVLIDGVYLDNAYQAVRLLCRERGTLENVTIRNVSGTCRAFGFYINPWYRGQQVSPDFEGTSGLIKNILIEDVKLKQENNPYDYNEPLCFCLGGTIKNITLRNIALESSDPDYRAVAIREGHGRLSRKYGFGVSPTHIDNLLIDGLYITDGGNGSAPKKWIEAEGKCTVTNMVMRNIYAKSADPTQVLIHIEEGAEIAHLQLSEVYTEGFEKVLSR